MKTTTKRIALGAAALAAVSMGGLSSLPSASAASDTPDNHWETIGFPNFPMYWQGYVMWNDYDNEYHDKDLDNIWVEDDAGDGYSTELRVYWNDKTYKTHAYNGDEARLSFGNVPNNHKVYYKICQWDDGHLKRCTDTYSFRE